MVIATVVPTRATRNTHHNHSLKHNKWPAQLYNSRCNRDRKGVAVDIAEIRRRKRPHTTINGTRMSTTVPALAVTHHQVIGLAVVRMKSKSMEFNNLALVHPA